MKNWIWILVIVLVIIGVVLIAVLNRKKEKLPSRLYGSTVKAKDIIYMPETPQYFYIKVISENLDSSKTHCITQDGTDVKVAEMIDDPTDLQLWYFNELSGKISAKTSTYCLTTEIEGEKTSDGFTDFKVKLEEKSTNNVYQHFTIDEEEATGNIIQIFISNIPRMMTVKDDSIYMRTGWETYPKFIENNNIEYTFEMEYLEKSGCELVDLFVEPINTYLIPEFIDILMGVKKIDQGLDCPITLFPDDLDLTLSQIDENTSITINDKEWEEVLKALLNDSACYGKCYAVKSINCSRGLVSTLSLAVSAITGAASASISDIPNCMSKIPSYCRNSCLTEKFFDMRFKIDKILNLKNITFSDGTCDLFIQPNDSNGYLTVTIPFESPEYNKQEDKRITCETSFYFTLLGDRWWMFSNIFLEIKGNIKITIPITCNEDGNGYIIPDTITDITKNLHLTTEVEMEMENYEIDTSSADNRNRIPPTDPIGALKNVFQSVLLAPIIEKTIVGTHYENRVLNIIKSNMETSLYRSYKYLIERDWAGKALIDVPFIGCPLAPLGCPYPAEWDRTPETKPTDMINYSENVTINNGTCIPDTPLKDVAPILKNKVPPVVGFSVQQTIDSLKVLKQPYNLVGYSIQPVSMSEEEQKEIGFNEQYRGFLVAADNIDGCKQFPGATYYVQDAYKPDCDNPKLPSSYNTLPNKYKRATENTKILPAPDSSQGQTIDKCKEECEQDTTNEKCIGISYLSPKLEDGSQDTVHSTCNYLKTYSGTNPKEKVLNKTDWGTAPSGEDYTTYYKTDYKDFVENENIRYTQHVNQKKDGTLIASFTQSGRAEECAAGCNKRSDCEAYSYVGEVCKIYSNLEGEFKEDKPEKGVSYFNVKNFTGCLPTIPDSECVGAEEVVNSACGGSGNKYCFETCADTFGGKSGTSLQQNSEGKRTCKTLENDVYKDWYVNKIPGKKNWGDRCESTEECQ